MVSHIQHPAVYSKLEEDLRQDIICNNVDFEKPLPGELELCEKYSISRKSVRKALETLCAEGLLARVQGKGTFAIPPQIRIPLMSAKKLNILLMIPWFYAGTTEYDEELIKGINSYASRNGHSLEFSDTEIDPEEIISKHKSGEIDGVICERPFQKVIPDIMRLYSAGIPVVSINRYLDGIPCVCNDYRCEVRSTVQFLSDIGHGNILFVNSSIPNDSALFRKKYFNEMTEELKIHKNLNAVSVECDHLNVGEKLASLDFRKLSAVVIGGHNLLGGVLNFFRREKIVIPQDISLICLNDSLLARSYSPPLTVFTEPRSEMGEKAVEVLENIVAGKILKYDSIKIEGELIMRKSCGLPKKYGRNGQ